MTQQMGSTSGTAPAARDTEVAPGGASDLTSEPMTAAASGGTPGVTEAGWQPPDSTGPAGPTPAGTAESKATENAAAENGTAENGTTENEAAESKAAARRRNWLRRTAPAATDIVPIAPSVVAA